MTFDELEQCKNNTPIRTVDNKFGLLIRWDKDRAGFQIAGEENIRWINHDNLIKEGDALVERIDNKAFNMTKTENNK